MAGEFLKSYFEERGDVEVKSNSEADVLCPFEHDKGYEKRPSAHINMNKGVFHCKTCFAEGRFNKGGLSEADFVSKLYNVKYKEAIRMIETFEGYVETEEDWQGAVDNLLGNPAALAYLASRGITDEMVLEYQIGYAGKGIVYPVFMNGILIDKRTYNMSPEPNEPKIKSELGASPMLFPYDHWKNDPRPTIFSAGESDTLLARKHGFNAVTSTFGEGSFPKVFLASFKGKDVYVCLDCDEAGKTASKRVAFMLKEAGANVKIVDLGLPGTKEDKDITDFFIKHGFTAEDFQAKLDEAILFDGEMFMEAKNEEYPLVDLWKVPHGEYSGKRLSARVNMMGKYDQPMEVPTAIKWECNNPNLASETSPCHFCTMRGEDGWWTLDDDNLDDVLELVEVDKKTQKRMVNELIGCPPKCPGIRKEYRAKEHVQKVILAPDVETEDEISGFRMTELYAYSIGMDLEDGQRYRIFFKRYPHPKNQQIVAVVDRFETSDTSVNAFKMNEDILEQLTQFQGDPNTILEKRFQDGKSVVGEFMPRNVFEAVNIMYHSVLDFKYHKSWEKGYPEGLVVGPSRIGKSKTAEKWQQFLALGNMTNVKNASVAGLLGGADKLPSGGHRIRWGTIPRNNRGLLFLDEMSGIPQQTLSALTALRSERMATLEKIVSGKAPANTRMMWISNQRPQSDGETRPISLYSTGVDVIRELVGTNEDIARFDFIVLLPEVEDRISPFTSKDDIPDVDNTAYRNLIYWVWSRTREQTQFDRHVDKYIWQVAEELNDTFNTFDLNLFGTETYLKIARISVAVAAQCFSHDGTGEVILVKKEHVDWASNFLVSLYDNETFRIKHYVDQKRSLTTTNEEIDSKFASYVTSKSALMQVLAKGFEMTTFQLQSVSGLDKKDFDAAVSDLIQHGLLEIKKSGVQPTLRFRKARENYLNLHQEGKMGLTPLSKQGIIPI